MNRRDFLKGSAAAMVTGGLAAPSLATTGGTKLLRFVPQTNLGNLDPIWGTQYVVRNASLLIWDTLYGVDSKLDPKPQMAEGHEVTDDGRTWTFKLRAGLKFHDGEPVLSRDVIASLTRWMARDTMGQMIRARLDALEALDDRTFRFRLNKPFSKMRWRSANPIRRSPALCRSGSPKPIRSSRLPRSSAPAR
jgi:peptide/nickel transport system substrate-binding protein